MGRSFMPWGMECTQYRFWSYNPIPHFAVHQIPCITFRIGRDKGIAGSAEPRILKTCSLGILATIYPSQLNAPSMPAMGAAELCDCPRSDRLAVGVLRYRPPTPTFVPDESVFGATHRGGSRFALLPSRCGAKLWYLLIFEGEI
jgi:hypothetical protein